VSVWRLLGALLWHVVCGRGRHRVFVLTEAGLPQAAQNVLDADDWVIVESYAPPRCRDGG
jgi:hypothetical protein